VPGHWINICLFWRWWHFILMKPLCPVLVSRIHSTSLDKKLIFCKFLWKLYLKPLLIIFSFKEEWPWNLIIFLPFSL
jgi:hypothetical protein